MGIKTRHINFEGSSDLTILNQCTHIADGTLNGLTYCIYRYGKLVLLQIVGQPTSTGVTSIKITNLPKPYGGDGDAVWMKHICAQDNQANIGAVYIFGSTLYFRIYVTTNYVCEQFLYVEEGF